MGWLMIWRLNDSRTLRMKAVRLLPYRRDDWCIFGVKIKESGVAKSGKAYKIRENGIK